MRRIIAIIAIIAIALVCLPAWAGIWKDNFAGGDLNRWQKFDGVPDAPSWNVINGELVADVRGIIKERGPVRFPFAAASGRLLPAQAPIDIAAEDEIIAEVKLKAEPTNKEELFRTIGMVIAKKDNLGAFYTVTWAPTGGAGALAINEEGGSLHIGFLGAGGASRIHAPGFEPSQLRAEMGKWYKMKLIIKQRPFQVQVYWDNALIKEFGVPFGGDKNFLVGAVGLWAGGYAFQAHFDDFVMAWGDSIKDLPLSVHPKSKLATTWGKIKAGR